MVTLVCRICRRQFPRNAQWARAPAVCSDKCKRIHASRRQTAWLHARRKPIGATLPNAQRLGVRCPVCGADAWGIEYRKKIVCRACRPEQRGPRAWPRLVKTILKGSDRGALRFSDSARLRPGQTAMVYREPWGYRVVLQPGGRPRGRAAPAPDRGIIEIDLKE